MEFEVGRQLHTWQWHIVKTNHGMTVLAIEMHMLVVIDILVVAMAEFVFHSTLSVFYYMHQMMLFEDYEGAKYRRLIQRQYAVFQLLHRHWFAHTI